MRFLPTRVHGILDYLFGAALVVAPRLLDFAGDGAETTVTVMFGMAIIAAGLFTDYELGLIRALPMPVHLVIDGLGGAFLALSPWILGFADVVYLPHLLAGLLMIAASFVTEIRPRHKVPGDPDDMAAHPDYMSEEQARPPYPEEF